MNMNTEPTGDTELIKSHNIYAAIFTKLMWVISYIIKFVTLEPGIYWICTASVASQTSADDKTTDEENKQMAAIMNRFLTLSPDLYPAGILKAYRPKFYSLLLVLTIKFSTSSL
jgi:hypothetical protein